MTDKSELRIVLAGSVSFSRITLERLIRLGANVVGVLGLDPSASQQVSDYTALEDIAAAASIPFRSFAKINDPEIVASVRDWAPDVLFVVGLSQLVGEDLMRVPRRGAIGFHPTPLPKGRGRAPIAWLTWDGAPGAATFFLMEHDADAGAIFVQEPFDVRRGMYAGEVIEVARAAIVRALDRWVPNLLAGEWSPVPQDDAAASFWAKRAPADGLIDWRESAAEIARLVRTASHPYPGAYTYRGNQKLIIWRASAVSAPFRGVPARVLHIEENGSFLVQTGSGLLRVEECSLADVGRPKIAVGQRLGFAAEDEIVKLMDRIRALEEGRGSS